MYGHAHVSLMHADLKTKNALTWHVLIRMIGISLIGLFLPAILRFEYGLSLSQIFLYESAYSVLAIVLIYTNGLPFIARHGTVMSMIVGVLMLVINFVILYLAKTIPLLILLSPIFAGCYVAFFRTGFHVSLAMGARKDAHFGTTYSMIEIVGVVAGILGPLVGGVIADWFGSSSLYILTVVCLLFSIIPFLQDKHRLHEPIIYKPSQIWGRIKKRTGFLGAVLGSFSSMAYAAFVASVVWSIILFGELGSYSKVGLINFFSSGILFGVLWVIGKQVDKNKKAALTHMRWIYLSVRGQGGVWLIAGLSMLLGFFSQAIFLLVDTIHKITQKVNDTYIMTRFYTLVDHKGDLTALLDTIFVRECAIHGTRVIICRILALLTAVIPGTKWGLILPLILVMHFAPLSTLLLNRKLKTHTKKVNE